MALICGCGGITGANSPSSNAENAKVPAIESIWATHYDSASNTSQMQAVLVAGGSTTVTQTIKVSGFFEAGGSDPGAQLMFGALLPFPESNTASRQLLVFRYDSNSSQLLSATAVSVPAGEFAGSMAVVPALKSVYLFSPMDGGFVDFFGHLLLVHYDRDGSIRQPIDATPPENNPFSPAVEGNLAYGEKTSLLFGSSSLSAHEPTAFPVFASVTPAGLPSSSFARFTTNSPPPVTTPSKCFSGGGKVLAYTRDGTFEISYDGEQNALIIATISSSGAADFAGRTDTLGADCSGPIVRAAALDETHNALYAVLQTLDANTEAPISAVLARFNFDPMTGAISSAPVQQISIAATTNRVYIPRYGSRVFIYDVFDHSATNLTTYALTGDGPQNPQQVGFSFSPDLLFGDVPIL
ncbi:MAG TPA: hypothetical protein VKW06_18865 [Candidatus Angelobacter sp.]|nr:hypothetical protein [Candidatus Angelobacter sp.]